MQRPLQLLTTHELDRAEHDATYTRTGTTAPIARRMLAEVLAARERDRDAPIPTGITPIKPKEIRRLLLAAKLGLGATWSETIQLIAEVRARRQHQRIPARGDAGHAYTPDRIDRSAPPPVS